MKKTDQEELDMDESRGTLIDHLSDLAHSVKWSLGSVLFCFVCCLGAFQPIYQFLTEPLYLALETLNLDSTMKFRTVQGAFMFHFKMAILGGFIFAMPMIFYQVWRFIAPGLYKHERRLVIPFVLMTSSFFFLGVMFCYYIVLPFGFDFFLSYSQKIGERQLLPDITLEDYLSTITKLLLAFGCIFQTPIFLGFLAWIELITHRTLIDWWRWATVVIFCIAAFLTPPDYVTQTLLALPLMTFYALSILIAWYITKHKEVERSRADHL